MRQINTTPNPIPQPGTLEEILQKYFGVEKPFKQPSKPKSDYESHSERVSDHFTPEGEQAYITLQNLLTDIEFVLDKDMLSADAINDELDLIAIDDC